MSNKRKNDHLTKENAKSVLIAVGVTYTVTTVICKVISGICSLAKVKVHRSSQRLEKSKLEGQSSKKSMEDDGPISSEKYPLRKLKRDPSDSPFPPSSMINLDRLRQKDSFPGLSELRRIASPDARGNNETAASEEKASKDADHEQLRKEIEQLKNEFRSTLESSISLRDFLRENLSTSNKLRELEAENKRLRCATERLDGEVQALKAMSIVSNGQELEMFKLYLQQPPLHRHSGSSDVQQQLLQQQLLRRGRSGFSTDGRSDGSDASNKRSMMSQLYGLFRGSPSFSLPSSGGAEGGSGGSPPVDGPGDSSANFEIPFANSNGVQRSAKSTAWF